MRGLSVAVPMYERKNQVHSIGNLVVLDIGVDGVNRTITTARLEPLMTDSKKSLSFAREANETKAAGKYGYAASAMPFHSLAVSSMSLPPIVSNSVARS